MGPTQTLSLEKSRAKSGKKKKNTVTSIDDTFSVKQRLHGHTINFCVKGRLIIQNAFVLLPLNFNKYFTDFFNTKKLKQGKNNVKKTIISWVIIKLLVYFKKCQFLCQWMYFIR